MQDLRKIFSFFANLSLGFGLLFVVLVSAMATYILSPVAYESIINKESGVLGLSSDKSHNEKFLNTVIVAPSEKSTEFQDIWVVAYKDNVRSYKSKDGYFANVEMNDLTYLQDSLDIVKVENSGIRKNNYELRMSVNNYQDEEISMLINGRKATLVFSKEGEAILPFSIDAQKNASIGFSYKLKDSTKAQLDVEIEIIKLDK